MICKFQINTLYIQNCHSTILLKYYFNRWWITLSKPTALYIFCNKTTCHEMAMENSLKHLTPLGSLSKMAMVFYLYIVARFIQGCSLLYGWPCQVARNTSVLDFRISEYWNVCAVQWRPQRKQQAWISSDIVQTKLNILYKLHFFATEWLMSSTL